MFQRADNQAELLNEVFDSKAFDMNRGTSTKLLFQLLALFFNNKIEHDYVKKVIEKIPSMSMNKDGKRIQELSRILKKYFINELAINVDLPNLDNLNINNNLCLEFKKIVQEAIIPIVHNSSCSNEEKAVFNKIATWVNLFMTTEGSESHTTVVSAINVPVVENGVNLPVAVKVSDEKTSPSVSTQAQKTSIKPLQEQPKVQQEQYQEQHQEQLQKKLKEQSQKNNQGQSQEKPEGQVKEINQEQPQTVPLDEYSRLKLISSKNAEALKSVEKQYNLTLKDKEKLQDEKKILEVKFKDLELKTKYLQDIIDELNQKINGFKDDLNKLNREKNDKETECMEKDKKLELLEIENRLAIENIYNKLAEKLETDYRDYLDCVKLQMTADLGENMRIQLNNIFKILKDNGINL